MSRARKSIVPVALLAALSVLASLSPVSAQPDKEDAGVALALPDRLAVYDFNIHQMGDDWKGWVQYVKDNPDLPIPDILIVQDLPDPETHPSGGRPALRSYLSSVEGFGVPYSVRANSHQHPDIALERAVFWRNDRLGLLDFRRFNGWGGPKGDCVKDAGNGYAVQVRLEDKLRDTRNKVSVVSFKTRPDADNAWCPWKNTKFMNYKLTESGWSGALHIMGTDSNHEDWNPDLNKWRCWYRGTNGSLGKGCPDGADANRGYVDPIYVVCGGNKDCTSKENTTIFKTKNFPDRRRRIDFIFAKAGNGNVPATDNAQTLPRGPAGCSAEACFSDHNSVHSYVIYE